MYHLYGVTTDTTTLLIFCLIEILFFVNLECFVICFADLGQVFTFNFFYVCFLLKVQIVSNTMILLFVCFLRKLIILFRSFLVKNKYYNLELEINVCKKKLNFWYCKSIELKPYIFLIIWFIKTVKFVSV